jgi:hypothetical protein
MCWFILTILHSQHNVVKEQKSQVYIKRTQPLHHKLLDIDVCKFSTQEIKQIAKKTSKNKVPLLVVIGKVL